MYQQITVWLLVCYYWSCHDRYPTDGRACAKYRSRCICPYCLTHASQSTRRKYVCMHVMYMCMCMYLSSGLQDGNKCSVVKAEATSCPCPWGWAREQADTLSHVDTHTCCLLSWTSSPCFSAHAAPWGERGRAHVAQDLNSTRDSAKWMQCLKMAKPTNNYVPYSYTTQLSSSLSTTISLYGGQRNRRSRVPGITWNYPWLDTLHCASKEVLCTD